MALERGRRALHPGGAGSILALAGRAALRAPAGLPVVRRQLVAGWIGCCYRRGDETPCGAASPPREPA
jgi:hypothetical protein